MMHSSPTQPAEVADSLIMLLKENGTGDYIGESISQLEHCLQCAYFGVQAGADDELVLAGLLHDIGQFLPLDAANDVQMNIEGGSVGRVGHEKIGEEYLKGLGFGPRIQKLVGSHVAAKRYLTAVDSSYYDGLSEASKQSLKFQGGPFKGQELEQFERDPLKEYMVMLRKFDDRAKIVGIEDQIRRVDTYRDMMVRHLQASSS